MSRAALPRRAILLCAATLLAFLVGAVAWFPAALAVRALPIPYACAAPTGTLWRGRCDDLRSGDASIGAVSWTLQARPLLGARLVAGLTWARSGSRLAGLIEASSSAILVRDLRGEADLSTLRTLPVWPPSMMDAWSPGEGRVRVELDRLELRGQRLTRIEGYLDVVGLVSVGSERWVLGDYRLTWGEGPTPVGALTDRGGPLEVAARVGAAAGDAWRVEGTVRARDPAWRPRLMIFGPADAAGRHAFSVESR